ncbi:NAD(P)/FAD-dependent oxidoreductase [Nocardia thailandica]
MDDNYDVVILGGGAAGLNGALMLARSRRSVLVIDSGSPRNAPADGVHGLLGREGMPPGELLALGRAEVESYGGVVLSGDVVAVRPLGPDAAVAAPVAGATVVTDLRFEVELADGRVTRARRLLLASGLADDLPDLPGLREQWGRGVLHCPYCHGWEVRDRRVGVLGTGPMSVHQTLLFRQLTDDVVLFTRGAELPGEDIEKLLARGVRVVPDEVTEIVTGGDAVTGVRLADGTVVARDAVAVGPRMNARAGFLADLGLAPVEHPMGIGEHVPADPTGRTSVDGVWAAGNVTDPSAQVGAAAAAGAAAGAQINADLVAEEAALAVRRRRAGVPA